jgi:hypothetical protein
MTPQNSYAEILIHQNDYIRRWGIWEVIRSLGQSLMNEIGDLIKEAPARDVD